MKATLVALVILVGVGACGGQEPLGDVDLSGSWSLRMNNDDCVGSMALVASAQGKLSGTWACTWSPVIQRLGVHPQLDGAVEGANTGGDVRLDFHGFVYDGADHAQAWLGPLSGTYSNGAILGLLAFKDRDFPFYAWRN